MDKLELLNVYMVTQNVIRVGNLNDVVGPHTQQAEQFARFTFNWYLKMRMHGNWAMHNLKNLRPLFLKIGHHLGNGQDLSRFLTTTMLGLKSALFFIVEDFPELAESLLYSPLMQQLDDTIDYWTSDKIPFGCLSEYDYFQEKFENYTVPESHTWWNCFRNVAKIQGVTLKRIWIMDRKLDLEMKRERAELMKKIAKSNEELGEVNEKLVEVNEKLVEVNKELVKVNEELVEVNEELVKVNEEIDAEERNKRSKNRLTSNVPQ